MTLNKPFGGTPSEACIAIAEYLGCECDYIPPTDNPMAVLNALGRAVTDGEANGYIPVMIQASDYLAEKLAYSVCGKYSSDIRQLDRKDIAKYRQNLIENLSDETAADFCRSADEELSRCDGKFEIAGGEVRNFVTIPFNSFAACSYELLLAKIPAANPWEVVAWLPIISGEECPEPQIFMALAKRWYEKYGAIICAVSGSEAEFRVKNPPSDRAEACTLAKEHYNFCSDRIDQNTKGYNLGTLANCLMKSKIWYFWWD